MATLLCLGLLCGGLGIAGLWGAFGNLDGGGRLSPIQTGLLLTASLFVSWVCVNAGSSLFWPGSVYLKGDQLHVGGVLESAFPVAEVVGFQEEPAPTWLFKTNRVLFIERTHGRVRVDSALNQASLREIREAIASH